MRVYEYSDPDALSARSHPWTDAVSDPTHRYRDFRAEPGLIRSSLEDWRPWEPHAGIETFYRMLEWLNGPSSIFETNDCAFDGPAAHAGDGRPLPMECSGRLMVLHRHLPANSDPVGMDELRQRFGYALATIDEAFEDGAVGVTSVPVHFRALPGPVGRQNGQQLMISFWAWGRDVAETLGNLHRTLGNVRQALYAANTG